MRDYGIVSWRIWTGDTGKSLRKLGPECQVVALYLLTCPNSNMIGLFYIPLPTLAHETGLSMEGASKALRRVCETDFAKYDSESEYVYVPNMAKWQVGCKLDKKDKRRQGVANELARNAKSPFAQDFWRDYADAYGLAEIMPKPSPIEAPSKPHRSQDQDQEQEQEQRQKQEEEAVANSIPSQLADLDLYAKDRTFCKRFPDLLPVWKKTYQSVSVMDEIRAAHAWEVSNPAKRKKDRAKFLNGWLSRTAAKIKASMPPEDDVPVPSSEQLRQIMETEEKVGKWRCSECGVVAQPLTQLNGWRWLEDHWAHDCNGSTSFARAERVEDTA